MKTESLYTTLGFSYLKKHTLNELFLTTHMLFGEIMSTTLYPEKLVLFNTRYSGSTIISILSACKE